MYNSIKLSENVDWVGVNDKETDLFESLWPLPEGISYNSYVINDDKVALIDTVRVNYTDTYLEKVKDVIGDKKVDYLIINHMEPDHSGSIKSMRAAFPEMKIVGNAKTMNFLEGFYGITDGTRVIKDGDVWLEMLDSRNLTAHTYDESNFNKSVDLIVYKYFVLINDLYENLKNEQ